MKQFASASNRVIFNTIVQYVRTFISTCIALYSSRIILRELGASDFGIYSLVSGVIVMLSFANLSLSSTTQRYLSFHQGKGDMQMQKKIFNNSIFLQLLLNTMLVVVLLSLTPFIFNSFLNLPFDRIETSKIVFYCVIGTTFFSMLSVPYIATLIAHENILYTSIIQLVSSILKLLIAISLIYVTYDKLIYYSLMIIAIAIIEFLAYAIYCSAKYDECKQIHWRKFDVKIFKEMFAFSGWMIYNTGCIYVRKYGIAVILNKFFGTIMNAAFGIAQQLSALISFITSSMLNAVKPQIVKAESNQDRKKVLRLAEITSKFSFFILAMIVIPAVFQMETIVKLWLGDNVPAYTVMFCQYALIMPLIDQLTIGLGAANLAIGNVKYFSLTIYTTKILSLPVAFLCLYLGFPPDSVMISLIAFEFISAIARLFFLKKTAGLSIRKYCRSVFSYEIIPISLTVFACYLCTYLPTYLVGISFLVSVIVLSTSVYFFGLCKDEKQIINRLFRNFSGKIQNKFL